MLLYSRSCKRRKVRGSSGTSNTSLHNVLLTVTPVLLCVAVVVSLSHFVLCLLIAAYEACPLIHMYHRGGYIQPPLQRSKEHSRSLSTLNLKRYVISQQGIQEMQFFDMRGHPNDQILATIVVTAVNADEGGDGDVGDGEDINSILPTVPTEDMEFTPGYTRSLIHI